MEHVAARFYGLDYVIAGRMIPILTELMIAMSLCDRREEFMQLWSVRYYLSNTYRRVK